MVFRVAMLALGFFLAHVADAKGKLEINKDGVAVLSGDGPQKYYTGLKPQSGKNKGLGQTHFSLEGCDELPDEFDLRDLDVVSPVKNQGQCGSCWAFSLTASLESAYAATHGRKINLSEQQLLSCDTETNMGCSGGYYNDFKYQISHGQTLETNQPYVFYDYCRAGLPVAAKGSGFALVGSSTTRATDKEVMCALYKTHTVPWITATVSQNWYNAPTGDNDVYTACDYSRAYDTNHAIGLVGWKTVNGKVYFKMRNSWGADWGSTAGRPGSSKGYAMMRLGCDNLGKEVAYITTTSALKCQPPMVKLPVETKFRANDYVDLTVKVEEGATYEWYKDGEKIADSAYATIAPEKDAIYRVVAHNQCGTSESSMRGVVEKE